MSLKEEIDHRRTFAIISHPDAGKTTLTEKFLLYGGAIQTAGAVKSNKIRRGATSDFMDIERQRGISVSTSVMTFNYGGKLINLLDTPGHRDFAEDTYRTLTAVDSVVLVIDCVKGVEAQTERLMEVCRMRNTPVIVFINKLDLEGRDPFDLLDELEEKLSIKVRPMSWPIGIGATFKGVYDMYSKSLRLFDPGKTKVEQDSVSIKDLKDPLLDSKIGPEPATALREDIDLIEGVYDPLNIEAYRDGRIAPVFFGSAFNNFGVKEVLNAFVDIAPRPQPRATDKGLVEPDDPHFSGFIFKIHANLDPNHRDRIAFLRICSGKFVRNTLYKHVRLEKQLRFGAPTSFLAATKQIVEEAWPGDVIGLFDTGNFKIGDTLTDGADFQFRGIPAFSPEMFRELVNMDPMKSKQLDKGIRQLTDEGVAQLFTQQPGNKKIVGCVGELQFEVISYRLEHEYGAKCAFQQIPAYKACWMTSTDEDVLDQFIRVKAQQIVQDKDDNPVFMAPSAYMLDLERRNNPEITFHTTSEFKTDIDLVQNR
ncbi:MAG: peptide chain release factor 3 [Flavobacteriales bacterium]|nr:peptide chain release factor 3 [Flavobacteriales bacterium]MBK6945093.1 peptide chain release factor 3 [Flavobacteriales bacterium]MBK7239442.1 peptide chain release factor 3 [Flavobacteriales bacterium]MBK9535350.1 peptide chain release factor 3 [Flavobacteriales bacterium]MBP9137559.1 peptide chain release factor 3 [Flavobacteriales bacterium]